MHNKVITKAADQTLKPLGLFKKGQSRVWIDDNFWFLIIVEFQPSGYSKGSHLNVAIHFLWDEDENLGFHYPKMSRGNSFVEYNGDDRDFFEKMSLLSKKAEDKVKAYRKFSNVEYAKKHIIKEFGKDSSLQHLYHEAMICALAEDKKAKKFFERFIEASKYNTYEYNDYYIEEVNERILPMVDDRKLLKEYVLNKVKNKRYNLSSKPSTSFIKVDN